MLIYFCRERHACNAAKVEASLRLKDRGAECGTIDISAVSDHRPGQPSETEAENADPERLSGPFR
jgi:hypothetical protein